MDYIIHKSGQRYEDFLIPQKKKLKSCNKYTKTHHLCPKLPYLSYSKKHILT